jgi:sugar phosphate isomerase/epimerase
MDLSIYTNFFSDLPMEQRLANIAKVGFRHCEIDAPIPFPDAKGALRRQVSRLRRHADSLGLSLHQAHGYWGEFLKPGSPEWKQRVRTFKEEIAVAADLGVKTIVAHPMYQSGIAKAYPPEHPIAFAQKVFEHNVDFFSEIKGDLAKNGVRVAIENMPGRREGFTTIDELLELVKALDSDAFGICLDSGHLNQASGDVVRFISRAGKRLYATHMHDCLNVPGKDLHLFPLFSSYDAWISWETVRDCLHGIAYPGTFNLETPGEGSNAGVPLWMREKKLAFVFACLTQFLGTPGQDHSST